MCSLLICVTINSIKNLNINNLCITNCDLDINVFSFSSLFVLATGRKPRRAMLRSVFKHLPRSTSTEDKILLSG